VAKVVAAMPLVGGDQWLVRVVVCAASVGGAAAAAGSGAGLGWSEMILGMKSGSVGGVDAM